MEATRSGVNGLLVVSRAVEVNVGVLEPALTRNQRIKEKLVWTRTWDPKPIQHPAKHGHVVSIDDYYTKDIIQIHTHTHTQACVRVRHTLGHVYIHTPIHAGRQKTQNKNVFEIAMNERFILYSIHQALSNKPPLINSDNGLTFETLACECFYGG